MTASTKTHAFQAEVNQVLSIVVNSLYSNKEVFLRELISNASDALDKLSFRALTEHGLLDGGAELTIDVIPNRQDGTLVVRDNGIGMTRDEVVDNLGTIARSGSRALMQSLSGDSKKDLALIGQFGVGFYSSFLVADRVTVTTRAAGDAGPATVWESEAKGEFTVGDAEKAERGTDVTLHLKADEHQLLDEWTLKGLIRKYSDYVRYPIRLQVERTEKAGAEEQKSLEWETVNSASALWTRPKAEISDEQYGEFYKHLSHEWEPPLAWTHFKVEGTHELTGLVFLPKRRPVDLFQRKPGGLRLFVKRVFIMEDCDEILPEWLRFVRGVVDSEDLPLNVSREVLQQDRTTQFIRKQVIARVLSLLEELAAEGERTEQDAEGNATTVDRFATFQAEFGAVLKEGVYLDAANRERIAKLLRYRSSAQDQPTSLADYVARMQPDQPGIYFITAINLLTARHSPHIEKLRERGYEVLLMTDPVDEWVVESLTEFDGKKLISATKGALDLPENEAAAAELEQKKGQLSGLLDKLKTSLDARVQEVRLTGRLTDSPACLVSEAHGISPHLERMLRASGQQVPPQKRILELNPDHPVVQEMQRLAGDATRAEQFEQWSQLLLDQALIAEGSLPEDPARVARGIAKLMSAAADTAS